MMISSIEHNIAEGDLLVGKADVIISLGTVPSHTHIMGLIDY